MKKFFMALAFVAGAVSAQAIEFNLPSFNDGHAHWIVRAGVGFNGIAGDFKDTQDKVWDNGNWDGSFNSTTGFLVGIGFNKSFGEHPLYWGMDLTLGMRGYEMKGTKDKDTGSVGTSVGNAGFRSHMVEKETLSAYNVEISPFTIGYKYTFLTRMAVDVHLGAYAAYDFAGNYKTKKTSDIYYYSGKNTHKSEDSKVKISDFKPYQEFDAGIKLGLGYWFGPLNIDFTWQRGFLPILDNGDDDVKIGKKSVKRGDMFTNNFQLTLGFSF